MKKTIISILSIIMFFNIFTVHNANAIEKKKESLNNLLSTEILYSMKQERLNYKGITLDTLNQNIQKKFGKPDKISVNTKNGITITQNKYTTKNKNTFNFYTVYFDDEKQYDRFRYLEVTIRNKNLKFSSIYPSIKKPYTITKKNNSYDYIYNEYFRLKLKKIDGELYVSKVFYASLGSLPE